MKKIIDEFKKKISELENNLNEEKNKNSIIKESNNNNDNLSKIIKLMEEIKEKDKEIKEIKSRYPFELKEGEKLMSIIFISVDHNIHYSIICKTTDIFNYMENKLYDKYPKYRELNSFFLCGSNLINKYKSIEENKIKDCDIIILKKYN